MPQPDLPKSSGAPNGTGADTPANRNEALEPVVTFVDLVNELNRHLSQLQYALLDLKEILVRCDRGQHARLAQEASAHIERIRRSASGGN